MTGFRSFALAAAIAAASMAPQPSTFDGLYVAGQSIAERGGPDYVHIGRNLEPGPLVLQVLYVDPAGAPLSDDAPDPGCGFA